MFMIEKISSNACSYLNALQIWRYSKKATHLITLHSLPEDSNKASTSEKLWVFLILVIYLNKSKEQPSSLRFR